jgi:hypothetical protein
MYSQGDIGKVIGFYRRPVQPEQLSAAADIKAPNNSVLMSYAVARNGMSREVIAAQLQDLSALGTLLAASVPPLASLDDVEDIGDFRYHMDSPRVVAGLLQARTGTFADCIGDKLIVAGTSPRTHVYPSGRKVPYHLLSNEVSANHSILDMGCADPTTDRIYIRENSIAMVLALLDVLGGGPAFEAYQDQFPGFSDALPGFVIAHELCELELRKSPELPDALEFETELMAGKFLEKEGVDIRSYLLLHQLAEYEEAKKGKNISRKILDAFSQAPTSSFSEHA